MKEANLKVGWYTKSILKVIVIALCWVSSISLFRVREAIADSDTNQAKSSINSSQKTTISKILDNPERYNGRKIRVIGKVEYLKFSRSQRGNRYTKFIIRDISHTYCPWTLQVSMEEHADIHNRDIVEVTGTFLFREAVTQSVPPIHQYSESSSGLGGERYVHGGTHVIQGGIKRLEADSVKKIEQKKRRRRNKY